MVGKEGGAKQKSSMYEQSEAEAARHALISRGTQVAPAHLEGVVDFDHDISKGLKRETLAVEDPGVRRAHAAIDNYYSENDGQRSGLETVGAVQYLEEIKSGARTPESLFDEELKWRKEYAAFLSVTISALKSDIRLPKYEDLAKMDPGEVSSLAAELESGSFKAESLKNKIVGRLSTFIVAVQELTSVKLAVAKWQARGMKGVPEIEVSRPAQTVELPPEDADQGVLPA